MTHPTLTRKQLLATCVLSFSASAFFLAVKNPFGLGFPLTALVSGLFHLVIYIFFNRIFPANPGVFSMLSVFNIMMLGFSVHYTGGILSPFNFFFFAIAISEAANGIDVPMGLVTALAVYLIVILGEFFKWFAPLDLSTSAVYANIPTVVLIAATTVFFMLVTSQSYKTVMTQLRINLKAEHEEIQSIRRQLLKMEAPSQVGLLVNKIVHDIRGPLGAIMGFVTLLKRENNLSPASREDCDVMLNELNRISNLLSRMMKYVKPGSLEKQVLCPVDLIETVLSVFSFYPGAKWIKIEKKLPKPDAVFIEANKEELQQVYFNLLKNSLESLDKSKREPLISIEIGVAAEYVIISIEDNGPGIPPDIIGRLGREIVSTKVEGAGVGLVIVKEILQGHKGWLEIKNREGNVGSRFVTHLPRIGAAREPGKLQENQRR